MFSICSIRLLLKSQRAYEMVMCYVTVTLFVIMSCQLIVTFADKRTAALFAGIRLARESHRYLPWGLSQRCNSFMPPQPCSTFARRRETGLKPSKEIVVANSAFASIANGASAFAGRTTMPTTSNSSTTTPRSLS
jgi:hypothetical protein